MNFNGFYNYSKFINSRMKRAIAQSHIGAVASANYLQKVVRKRLSDEDINFKFRYSNSIKVSKTYQGAEVYTDVEHAAIVEYGMPAGMSVSYFDILEWAAKKAKPKNLVSFTKTVVEKIQNVGLKPKFVWYESMKQGAPNVLKIVDAEFVRGFTK